MAIHPSIHANQSQSLHRSRSNRIHPSIYRPLPRRTTTHTYIHRYMVAWLVRRTVHRHSPESSETIHRHERRGHPNPLSTVTEGGLVSRESGVRAERGCQRRLPSPLDGRRTTRTWRFRFGDSGLRIYDDLIIRDPCPCFLLSYFSTSIIVSVIILLLKCVFLCMYL